MKTLVVLVLFVGIVFAEEFLVRCKRPICETTCDYYQTDQTGCDTCECMEDPCKNNPCPEGNACFPDADACEGKHPCTEMPPRCVEVHQAHPPSEGEPACPLVMCHLQCEYGVKKDDRGCELCDCHNPCEGHECGDQETCEVQMLHDIPTAKCKARPLCHRVHDIYMEKEGGMMPEPHCTDKGEFEPVQCHQMSGECWCVDDRGIEVPGTRGSEKPNCEPRHCHHAHVGFDMKHNMDSVESELEQLQKEMEKQLSNVMTIEQEFIDQIVVSPQGIDIVHVEFDVIRTPVGNGMTLTEVDVATTVYHLNMRINNGDVIIIFGDNELSPIPGSWKAEHNYENGLAEPELPADGPLREHPNNWSGRCYGVYRRHKVAFVVASIGSILAIFFLVYLLAVGMRKKRIVRKQKEKQMRTYRENLAFTNQLYDKMVLPTNDDVEEKKPLDDLNTVSVA